MRRGNRGRRRDEEGIDKGLEGMIGDEEGIKKGKEGMRWDEKGLRDEGGFPYYPLYSLISPYHGEK